MPNTNSSDQSELLKQVLDKLGHATESNDIVVKYAGTLSERMRSDVEVHLKMKFPKADRIVFKEDDTLVAGIRIEYRDYLYDDSVSSRFVGLKNAL